MNGTIPCLVIAGTHSGCGKTTIASGLMGALRARGLSVQPFKIGPDFIDPTHHTKICGRISRNLDPFMMGKAGVADTFGRACAGADVAIVEGVMGLFDGMDGTDCSSTAQVAKILNAPVLLVADARGMSRSIHALISGYRHFDPGLKIAGVIINRIGSPRHRQMIETSGYLPALGWIPKREEVTIKSRHLGLSMAHETGPVDGLTELVTDNVDLDAVLRVAGNSPTVIDPCPKDPWPDPRIRIGIAWDPAFCFYYQDNLDLLRAHGAELVFFSPVSERLPEVEGIYLGGGYPELHLAGLSESGCMKDIAAAVQSGMPVFGECGGLIYLTREITADRSYQLCGILPAVTEMTGNVQALGYVQGKTTASHPCFPGDLTIRGHEFHYSRVIPDSDARYAIRLSRGKGIGDGKDGLVQGSAAGTYSHIYFSSDFARHFIQSGIQFSQCR